LSLVSYLIGDSVPQFLHGKKTLYVDFFFQLIIDSWL
jgi:hypothetical protein